MGYVQIHLGFFWLRQKAAVVYKGWSLSAKYTEWKDGSGFFFGGGGFYCE